MADVNLTVSAELGDLRRQLESIPGITADQARLMVAELDRGYKKAEKAAASAAKATRASMKQAEEATRKASEAGKELGDKFGNVGSSAGKLSGALDMLAPGLGSVGQGIADLADVGEVAAGSLGGFATPALVGLAAAAALLGPALLHLEAEMAAEAEAARVMGTANEYARSELELQRTAALDLAVATGAMTEAQRNEADIRATSADRLGTYLGTLTATIEETRKAELRNIAIAETIGSIIDTVNKLNPLFWLMKSIMGDTLPTATDLTKKFADYVGVTGKLEAAEKNAAAAATVATEATKKTVDAQLKASKAKTSHAAAARTVTKAVKEEKVATDALNDASRTIAQAQAAELTESQKLTAQLGELLAERTKLSEAGKLTADLATKYGADQLALQTMITDAKIEEETRAYTAEQELIAKTAEAQEAARTADLEATMAYWQQRTSIANQATGVIADATQFVMDQSVQSYQDALDAQRNLADSASSATKKAAADEVKAKKKEALKWFYIDKAAKLAQAVTAGALAVVNALATFPAPNYVASGLAAASGAIQIATIAAARPSFHSGGMNDYAPDEASAIVRRGEAVLSPEGRRAIGDDTIRAANAGVAQSQTIVVQQVYRHRVFNDFIRDNLKTRSPLAQALGAGARTGQRR